MARSGGDYSDPVAAMSDLASWCPSPSAAAPCVLHILPGTYSLGAGHLTMASHVDLEGSGEGITTITASGSTSPGTATIMGAAAAELRHLTVENTGGAPYATALYNPSRLFQMTARAAGGTTANTAILSESSPYSFERIDEVTARVGGGSPANTGIAIHHLPSRPRLLRLTVATASSSAADTALATVSSALDIVESNITGGIGADLHGGDTILDDVTVNGAITTALTGSLTVQHSRLNGPIGAGSFNISIGASQIDSLGAGNIYTCTEVYRSATPTTCP